MSSFIFGGNTGQSYEDVQRMRAQAQQLAAANRRGSRNASEGLSALGRALIARHMNHQADQAEAAGRADYAQELERFANNPYADGPVAPVADLMANPYGSPYHRETLRPIFDRRMQAQGIGTSPSAGAASVPPAAIPLARPSTVPQAMPMHCSLAAGRTNGSSY